METLVPGKSLSFLNHHIRCGDSLLGATPAPLARRFPDVALEPIEGTSGAPDGQGTPHQARARPMETGKRS
jgi:hypothetical protein